MNILKLRSFSECFPVLKLPWQRWLYAAQCWYVTKMSNATDLAYSYYSRRAKNTGCWHRNLHLEANNAYRITHCNADHLLSLQEQYFFLKNEQTGRSSSSSAWLMPTNLFFPDPRFVRHPLTWAPEEVWNQQLSEKDVFVHSSVRSAPREAGCSTHLLKSRLYFTMANSTVYMNGSLG